MEGRPKGGAGLEAKMGDEGKPAGNRVEVGRDGGREIETDGRRSGRKRKVREVVSQVSRGIRRDGRVRKKASNAPVLHRRRLPVYKLARRSFPRRDAQPEPSASSCFFLFKSFAYAQNSFETPRPSSQAL